MSSESKLLRVREKKKAWNEMSQELIIAPNLFFSKS